MSNQNNQCIVEVLNFLEVDGLFMTHVKVLSGKIEIDSILESEGTGEQWQVISRALIQWVEIPKDDIQGLALKPLNQTFTLQPGMRMCVKS